jgi:DNA (cytosine-5)-methyltransferase 1
MKKIKVGSDFSGVGAFNQALTRLGIEYQEVYACDMDKYARQTFIHNYGEPKYYPLNVYDREIPSESLDIYMTSPPCQAFSLAGKRLGKEDKRGILFFNSLEFIQVNKPRFFIFENVKGLLSDDGGKTFSEWVNMLGGKSVNGNPVIFAYDDSVPYHLYWKVLNAKQHGVPQNRERVFLIGIRDDQNNTFRWPVEEHLTKRLKNVLEEKVDDKYFLSEKIIKGFLNRKNAENYPFLPKDENEISQCLTARYFKMGATDPFIKIKSATSKGYEEALDTAYNQGVMVSKEVRTQESKYERKKTGSNNFRGKEIEFRNQYHMNAITTSLTNDHLIESNYKIRRLTPRECFRLMDFPDTFTWPVSDSQAYKQAGNSIVVRVLEKIIKNLPL